MKNHILRPLLTLATIILSLSLPLRSQAQSDFNFTIYGGSTNFWSNTLFQLPTNIISNLTTGLISDQDYRGGSYRYEIFNVRQCGHKAKINNGRYFGFKARDLFSNIQYGLKIGWAPKFSPFGIYVSCAYQFRQFRAQFEGYSMEKYQFNSIRPGVGIRLTPFISLVEDDKWSPIVEIGTSYNYYFKTKAPFNNDKSQFNSGMISTFAIGLRNENISITGGVELDHYNLFNTKFSPDGGSTHPYNRVNSRHITIFIGFSHEFN
ncbi:MAG: hypothetical protein K2G94_03470 [Muribaculaceae bacterium]|nr:hypothetical protein [Muribaculaceae bacterium]